MSSGSVPNVSPNSAKPKKPYTAPTAAAVKLAELCERGTIAAVAAKIRATEGAVRHYIAGRRSPTPAVQRRIFAAYGIALAEWARPTKQPKVAARKGQRWNGTGAPMDAAAREARGVAVAAPGASEGQQARPATATRSLALHGLSNRERLAAIVERLEEEIARCDAGVPRNHVAALYGQLQAAVHKLVRLDGDGELTVSAILRSRAWAQIDHVLVEVLRKHAGAAEDLARALGQLSTPGGTS